MSIQFLVYTYLTAYINLGLSEAPLVVLRNLKVFKKIACEGSRAELYLE